MAEDKFSSFPDTPALPATSVSNVVPDDDADLETISTGLNVATPGTVRVTTREGQITDVFIAAGHIFPLRVRRIWATGTTATGIRALF